MLIIAWSEHITDKERRENASLISQPDNLINFKGVVRDEVRWIQWDKMPWAQSKCLKTSRQDYVDCGTGQCFRKLIWQWYAECIRQWNDTLPFLLTSVRLIPSNTLLTALYSQLHFYFQQTHCFISLHYIAPSFICCLFPISLVLKSYSSFKV